MLNVLALSFDDGLGIRWGKRVTCDRHVVLDMCHRVHENLLSLRQTENDGVILRYDCGLLTVHHTGSLIAVLHEDHTHVPVRVDGLRVHYTGAGDVGQVASLKELANDDGVYALCSFAGDCHDCAVGMALEGCPDLMVCQLTFRAKTNPVLHFVHLLLGWAYEVDEVQKRGIFGIDDSELLV